jgi:sigma-E factor negative regulatory protein RseC
MTEKVIEIPRQSGDTYQKGDSVEVLMKKSLGTRAVIIGYIVPFLLLIITLVAAFKISGNEGIAGLSSISVLAFYYGVLYLIRDRLRKTFTFTISRS